MKSHIKTISQYVESEGAMIPNAIVLAFSDPEVIFEKIECQSNALGEIGVLKVPNHLNSETRPAFIVDGQQRTQAIQMAKIPSYFPIIKLSLGRSVPHHSGKATLDCTLFFCLFIYVLRHFC